MPREGVAKDGRDRIPALNTTADACMLKPKCCPNMPARKIARSVREAARERPVRSPRPRSMLFRVTNEKKVEMLFAHLKRILRHGRLRLRGRAPRMSSDQPNLHAEHFLWPGQNKTEQRG